MRQILNKDFLGICSSGSACPAEEKTKKKSSFAPVINAKLILQVLKVVPKLREVCSY